MFLVRGGRLRTKWSPARRQVKNEKLFLLFFFLIYPATPRNTSVGQTFHSQEAVTTIERTAHGNKCNKASWICWEWWAWSTLRPYRQLMRRNYEDYIQVMSLTQTWRLFELCVFFCLFVLLWKETNNGCQKEAAARLRCRNTVSSASLSSSGKTGPQTSWCSNLLCKKDYLCMCVCIYIYVSA